ncbi:MAG: hypothetical protein RR054_01735 [Clostridia bacterium]
MEKKEKKTNYEKHLIKCEHCGKDVLDHFTECPFCHGELKGYGYKPMSDTEIKKIKTPLFIIGAIIAIVIVLIFVIK